MISLILASVSTSAQQRMPTLFTIGDSTVHNSSQGLQGWGDVIATFFDQTRIKVDNALGGGRSSRTYVSEGLWIRCLLNSSPATLS